MDNTKTNWIWMFIVIVILIWFFQTQNNHNSISDLTQCANYGAGIDSQFKLYLSKMNNGARFGKSEYAVSDGVCYRYVSYVDSYSTINTFKGI